jgi:hypothetical protein
MHRMTSLKRYCTFDARCCKSFEWSWTIPNEPKHQRLTYGKRENLNVSANVECWLLTALSRSKASNFGARYLQPVQHSIIFSLRETFDSLRSNSNNSPQIFHFLCYFTIYTLYSSSFEVIKKKTQEFFLYTPFIAKIGPNCLLLPKVSLFVILYKNNSH